MPIKGLTDRGLAFPEIGQIRKGAKKTGNAPGKDLDYFRVEFDEMEEETRKKFISIYKNNPKEINIILPFNEIDRMWDAWLEAYTAGRMVARSDGETVQYACDGNTGQITVRNGVNIKTGQPEPHPENNVAGYDYQNKAVEYKPSGRLKVIVPELGRAAYLTVMTTSIHDIQNISAQLSAFHTINNGQIAGIPFVLRRKPKQISVPMNGKRVRMAKSLMSIEADPEWVQKKLVSLNNAALPDSKLLSLPEPEDDNLEVLETDYDDDELEGEVESQSEEGIVIEKEEAAISRPYPAETLKNGFEIKIKNLGSGQVTVSQGQIGMLVGKYNEILGADVNRYEVFEFLYGVRSSKKLTPQQVVVGLSHLNGDEDMAKKEIIAVRDYCLKQAGQKSFVE